MSPEIARRFFPKSQNIYLLSHSIGRMPVSTEKVLQQQWLEPWRSDRDDTWNNWLAAIDGFRQALSRLFNAPAHSFCPQTNVSSGLTKFIQSQPTRRGQKVFVMCENDFPSAGFVMQHVKKQGYRIHMLLNEADIADLDIWHAALADDVHTVFISHVHYNSSKRAPVKEICELARERGIFSVVDVAQSAGVVPIDLSAWDADAVVGSSIKWLCGGPGAGFLWINPKIVEDLNPKDVGWFSHRDPFEFDINHFEYASDSNRFWGGTPSVAPYIVAANSINIIREIGVEVIRVHNQMLIEKLLNSFDADKVISPLNEQQRGGTGVVRFAQPNLVELHLKSADVQFDIRGEGFRFSPHIYNTPEQIDGLISMVQK